uniref:NADH dehydrogenase subunit 6 n=1 Tax=Ditylenchus dipsaci TaxID=166011 RepID=A0A915DZF8_9BILA
MNLVQKAMHQSGFGFCCSNYIRLQAAGYFVLYFELVSFSALISYLAAIVAIKCCSVEQFGVLCACAIQAVFCFILFVGLQRSDIVYLKLAMTSFLLRIAACLVLIIVGAYGLWMNSSTQQSGKPFE